MCPGRFTPYSYLCVWTESSMDAVIYLTTHVQAGVVMLIDGVPGIVIAPGGRAQALLQIGVGDDNRIHTIDITGGADRLRRVVLALPRWPSQNCHMPIGYQGHQK